MKMPRYEDFLSELPPDEQEMLAKGKMLIGDARDALEFLTAFVNRAAMGGIKGAVEQVESLETEQEINQSLANLLALQSNVRQIITLLAARMAHIKSCEGESYGIKDMDAAFRQACQEEGLDIEHAVLTEDPLVALKLAIRMAEILGDSPATTEFKEKLERLQADLKFTQWKPESDSEC